MLTVNKYDRVWQNGVMTDRNKPPAPIWPLVAKRAGVSNGRWPNLFAAAGRRYGRGVRAALEEAGFGDVPIAGSRVIGVLTRRPATIGELAERLDLTKQAVSKMCDSLVERGYASRSPHERDRRRLLLTLTDKGGKAAWVIGQAVKNVDDELLAHFDADQLGALARGLAAFVGQPPPGDDSRPLT